jgi:hypothetical protein
MPTFGADALPFGPHQHLIEITLHRSEFGAKAYRLSGAPEMTEVPFQIGPMKGTARMTQSPTLNWSDLTGIKCTLELVLTEEGEGVSIADMLLGLCENMEVERGSDAARD